MYTFCGSDARFNAASVLAPLTTVVVGTAVSSTGADTVAGVSGALVDGVEFLDTFVERIFAMLARPDAITAAALMAPTIGPAMGPSCWAVEKAVTAPEIISMVAAAMRRFFASLPSFSRMSARFDVRSDTPDAYAVIVSILCFAASFAATTCLW